MGSKQPSNFAAHQAGSTDASPCPNAALAVCQRDPTGARLSFSPLDIARQRLATLQTFDRLKARRGAAKAVKIVGVSLPTLSRWRHKLAVHGLAGLQPKPPGSGKRGPFAKVRLAVKAASELERLMVATGNPAAAWLQFAGSPLCPPLIARHIKKTGTPPARFAGVEPAKPTVPANGEYSTPKESR